MDAILIFTGLTSIACIIMLSSNAVEKQLKRANDLKAAELKAAGIDTERER